MLYNLSCVSLELERRYVYLGTGQNLAACDFAARFCMRFDVNDSTCQSAACGDAAKSSKQKYCRIAAYDFCFRCQMFKIISNNDYLHKETTISHKNTLKNLEN